MALVEAITILATLKAVDLVSDVLGKVSESFGAAASAAETAAAAAEQSGALFDSSMLQTASGVDALDLAAARASTAQEKLAVATRDQAAAEQELLSMRSAIATEDELAAAADRLAAAQTRATAATTELGRAKEIVGVFKQEKVTGDLLTDAMERLTLAQREATTATRELSAAQEQQKGLIGQTDVAASADRLAAAERRVAASSREAEAAQARLLEVELRTAAAAGSTAAQETLAAWAADEEAAAANRASGANERNAAAMSKAKNAAFLGAAVVAGIGYESIKSAMNFQTLTQRLVTTAGESATSLDYIRTGIMKVAQQTGTSANDLAKSMYTVEAAGYDAAHGGLDVLRAATQGATLEGSDFGTVANAVTDILKDYHKGADQAANMTSQLVAAVASGKANFQTMSAAMSNVLPIAAAVHLKFNDVAGVLAEMTSHGVTAQRASQNLANAIQSLEKPSSTMTKEFKAVGITAQEVQGRLASQGLGGTLQWLSQIAATNAPKLKQTYSGALGSLVGTSAALRVALMTTGENANDTAKAIARIGKASADAHGNVKGFSDVQKTAGYQMNALKASLTNTGIAIGTALLPAVVSIAKALNQVITPIMKWVQQHQTLVKHLFEGVAAILAVVGAVKLVTTVVEIFTGVMELLVANPWVAAIAALIIIVIYCYTHFKTFRDVINTVMKVVGGIIKGTITGVVAIFKWLAQAAEAVWHALVVSWNAVVGAAKFLWGQVVGIWNALSSVTTTVWNAISGFFEKWWPLLLLIFATPIALLIGMWNHCHQAIFSAAKSTWNAISSFFVGAWHLITGAAQVAWNLFKSFVITPIMAIWNWIQPVIHTIMSFLSTEFNGGVNAVKAIWSFIYKWIVKPITDAFNWLMGWIGKFVDIGTNIVQGIINGLTSAAGWLMQQVSNLANDALNAAKSVLGIKSPSRKFADEIGKWIPHGIAAGINEHAHVAKNAVKALSSGLTAQASSTLNSSLMLGGGFSPIGGGYGASGGQPAVSIHFDLREAKIMNDRDVESMIQKIEKRLATVTLPSGGYRSKF